MARIPERERESSGAAYAKGHAVLLKEATGGDKKRWRRMHQSGG